MRRRFPQPVRVGDLIGLPVLDDSHVTIGLVRQAVRTPEGRSCSSSPIAACSGGEVALCPCRSKQSGYLDDIGVAGYEA